MSFALPALSPSGFLITTIRITTSSPQSQAKVQSSPSQPGTDQNELERQEQAYFLQELGLDLQDLAREKKVVQSAIGVSLGTIGACLVELAFAIGKAPNSLSAFIYGATTLIELISEKVLLNSTQDYRHRLSVLSDELQKISVLSYDSVAMQDREFVLAGRSGLTRLLPQPQDEKQTQEISLLQKVTAGVIAMVVGLSLSRRGQKPLDFLKNPVSDGINQFFENTWECLGLKAEWQKNIAQSALLTLPMLWSWKAKQALVSGIQLNPCLQNQLQGAATAQKVCTFESLLQGLPEWGLAGGLTLAKAAEIPYGLWAIFELLRSAIKMDRAF
ncbi:MAG: hypothetical protein SFT81_02670 [Candidatus Caenarcaniphilales bacterium]|nr:hypothetical protein [Candidatus Caenarcaniphilales bacterium]